MGLGRRLKNILRRFIGECWGPTATEYAVLLVLVLFGCLTAIALLGSMVSGSMQSTADAIPSGASSGDSGDSGSGKSKSKKAKKPSRRRRRRASSESPHDIRRHEQYYALAKRANPRVDYGQRYRQRV